MRLVLFIILTLVFLAAILLERAYRTLTPQELRRRARSGHDKQAAAIYKAAAYEESLEILLWLLGSASVSAIIIMAANAGWWLAALLIMAFGFFIFVGRLTPGSHGWQWQAASWVAMPVAAVLSFIQPAVKPVGVFIKNARPDQKPNPLYEKEDLLEMLKSQSQQPDNRFSDAELAIVRGALTFGDKRVGQIMTPRAKLKLITATDPVGPHLMDELHASGLAAYPVVKEISRGAGLDVIGVLYLSDLVDHSGSGKVRELMRPKVYYVNEAQSLREALAAFVKTRAHLLIVVNNFEEVAGALTIEQLTEQILGHKITSEFDRYDDLPSVAGLK